MRSWCWSLGEQLEDGACRIPPRFYFLALNFPIRLVDSGNVNLQNRGGITQFCVTVIIQSVEFSVGCLRHEAQQWWLTRIVLTMPNTCRRHHERLLGTVAADRGVRRYTWPQYMLRDRILSWNAVSGGPIIVPVPDPTAQRRRQQTRIRAHAGVARTHRSSGKCLPGP